MFVWIVIVRGNIGKPMNTTTMLDIYGMNNNTNTNNNDWFMSFIFLVIDRHITF